ncbi:trypsin-6-like isoform X2 [Trichoplusia ni]|uniref:Trypsin-6-like isoform X2 n=1 Tax=Trichoplusia ni TaxID=7111 RepID=A0A7E5VIN0_TRINI|nr:trypsin-6-like isoform X2 [Trichoplusia ni]
MSMWGPLLLVLCACAVNGKLDEDEDQGSSGEHDLDDSTEKIGASISTIYQHPYAATLNSNGTYVCSAIVLNTYWLLTLSKCFDAGIISSYVTHKNLGNFTVRAGSSYNNKGGNLYKIKMLINNFDLRVSAAKLESPMTFSSQVQNVKLPDADDDITLGFLASIIAWTPGGHMRLVNAPVIDPSICEANTKMLPGHYVCVGGVQDPNRHFCRRDNGGAVIQNDTLVAISSFINTCALYSKTHAFPKVASFVRWLDSIIWDEDVRPTTPEPPTTASGTKVLPNSTKGPNNQPYYADPGKFMLTLPFDPINVPLEPAEDNSVLPRMSLYESYLQSLAKAKTSTTEDTSVPDQKTEPVQPYVKPVRPQQIYRRMPKKYDRYDYH